MTEMHCDEFRLLMLLFLAAVPSHSPFLIAVVVRDFLVFFIPSIRPPPLPPSPSPFHPPRTLAI